MAQDNALCNDASLEMLSLCCAQDPRRKARCTIAIASDHISKDDNAPVFAMLDLRSSWLIVRLLLWCCRSVNGFKGKRGMAGKA